jgi:hypothetical protein
MSQSTLIPDTRTSLSILHWRISDTIPFAMPPSTEPFTRSLRQLCPRPLTFLSEGCDPICPFQITLCDGACGGGGKLDAGVLNEGPVLISCDGLGNTIQLTIFQTPSLSFTRLRCNIATPCLMKWGRKLSMRCLSISLPYL